MATINPKLIPHTRLEKASWESRNEGVHERVNFDDTIWGFDLAGGSKYGIPLRVTHVKKDSRADKAGIRAGDKLKRINDIKTETLTLQEAHDIIMESGVYIRLAVTAPEDTDTTFSSWQDEIDNWATEEQERLRLEELARRRKVVCKTNSKWSAMWPWTTRKTYIYKESNCFLVPSIFEEKHKDRLTPSPSPVPTAPSTPLPDTIPPTDSSPAADPNEPKTTPVLEAKAAQETPPAIETASVDEANKGEESSLSESKPQASLDDMTDQEDAHDESVLEDLVSVDETTQEEHSYLETEESHQESAPLESSVQEESEKVEDSIQESAPLDDSVQEESAPVEDSLQEESEAVEESIQESAPAEDSLQEESEALEESIQESAPLDDSVQEESEQVEDSVQEESAEVEDSVVEDSVVDSIQEESVPAEEDIQENEPQDEEDAPHDEELTTLDDVTSLEETDEEE